MTQHFSNFSFFFTRKERSMRNYLRNMMHFLAMKTYYDNISCKIKSEYLKRSANINQHQTYFAASVNVTLSFII